ncbi:NAD(P)H-dependent glycerol-3-phosphate dehydrogenase [Spartinivicinus poritis]|uniref:Glycerol-3-phosphate dehydrogenase [NAD(P)+] n=1 Tax=Spartinivicinus poritis TaxID=2994640 RepID=A0ABT5U4B9_9GAMM|nr:NAD(P)H-dependent glycerol-3-phosphate dehydrogenase [Spartinivicinus sp. A2-2]MDE1461162.1 NAD(P)H-dependent glycerol-3-phosphate dehydrogenase [Spartinivicinus sp. A2-2]
MKRILAVLGGGSFGTAIANILCHNGHQVKLWLRDQQLADHINHQHVNNRYFPDYPLHPALIATTDPVQTVADAELVFIATPSKAFRNTIHPIQQQLAGKYIVSTTKGIEADSFMLMSQILQQEIPTARVGVLSGPNLAKEIMAKGLTATVIASADNELRQLVQSVLHCDYFRVYGNDDMFGVELGGALKNIYAIVAGMAEAMGMGANTKSMLITRALAEMSRFAVNMGANPMTFIGLAGVGDLIVTCMSPLSRNFQVGMALGQGKSLEEAETALGQVAEGVNTLQLVKDKADQVGVYMPLVSGLYEVVVMKQPVEKVVRSLMLGEQKTDVDFSVTELLARQ